MPEDEEVEYFRQIGEDLQRCYRAKTDAGEEYEDTAVIFGDLHSKLSGGRITMETVVLDTGCTKDIIAESIVSDLGLEMKKLDRPLNIVGAEGNFLNIVGTVIVFLSAQATGGKKRMIEAAVLRGGRDRELLVSLKNLKRMKMIHPTFPHQTVDDYFIQYKKNKSSKQYSFLYNAKYAYYRSSRAHLKKPS